MTAEDIFKEILKSPELESIFGIPQEELQSMDYNTTSNHKVIESIKAIIRGHYNNSDRGTIFRIIQNQIMQL